MIWNPAMEASLRSDLERLQLERVALNVMLSALQGA